MTKNILIFGASGAIGHALCKAYHKEFEHPSIFAVSKNNTHFKDENIKPYHLNDYSEESLKTLKTALNSIEFDRLIIATGILSTGDFGPEKSLRDIEERKFESIFKANIIFPALILKHFLPRMKRNISVKIGVLSARVGSISDNSLGGWYSYRASKAALNQIIKTASIEFARRNSQSHIIGLHPGTVDSNLSKPFQANVKEGKLFTPDYSAHCLLKVIETKTSHDTGRIFAYDGEEITP